MTDDNDTAERAKELLVYGPLGLAFFLRDSVPQFMRMFVARGRTELQQRSRSMGSQISQVRSLGESVTADSGPEMLRVLSTGIAALRDKAEEALGALGVTTTDAPARNVDRVDDRAAATSDPYTESADCADLAIRGYDDLSASQIVDQLDGLPGADLEAIRSYEAMHRARNTILGKIEQLTRGS